MTGTISNEDKTKWADDGTEQGPCGDGLRLFGFKHCGCPNTQTPWIPQCHPEGWEPQPGLVYADGTAEFTLVATEPTYVPRRYYEAVLASGTVRQFNGSELAAFTRFSQHNQCVERYSIVRWWDAAASRFNEDLEERAILAQITAIGLPEVEPVAVVAVAVAEVAEVAEVPGLQFVDEPVAIVVPIVPEPEVVVEPEVEVESEVVVEVKTPKKRSGKSSADQQLGVCQKCGATFVESGGLRRTSPKGGPFLGVCVSGCEDTHQREEAIMRSVATSSTDIRTDFSPEIRGG